MEIVNNINQAFSRGKFLDPALVIFKRIQHENAMEDQQESPIHEDLQTMELQSNQSCEMTPPQQVQ